MKDVFEITNWVTQEEVQQIFSIVESWEKVPFKPNYGRWPGELISIQSWHQWDDNDALGKMLSDRMRRALGNDIVVVETNYQQLHLPWDIHADLDRELKGRAPWYTFIIPLEDYDSRTIIFDQISPGYNDFYKFKQQNSKVAHPVGIDFWNSNLSHCWDEDREYLSLKYISRDWKAGDALFLKRQLMHSSDDFHVRGIKVKKFLQVLVDIK